MTNFSGGQTQTPGSPPVGLGAEGRRAGRDDPGGRAQVSSARHHQYPSGRPGHSRQGEPCQEHSGKQVVGVGESVITPGKNNRQRLNFLHFRYK